MFFVLWCKTVENYIQPIARVFHFKPMYTFYSKNKVNFVQVDSLA